MRKVRRRKISELVGGPVDGELEPRRGTGMREVEGGRGGKGLYGPGRSPWAGAPPSIPLYGATGTPWWERRLVRATVSVGAYRYVWDVT